MDIAQEKTRTTRTLAASLWDEIEALDRGDTTPQKARAKASMANGLIALARLELEYSRFVSSERTLEKGRLPALEMA